VTTGEPPPGQADAVLDALMASVEGGVVRGVYLYGSAIVGGLRPDSDLDLFAVIGRRLTGPERQALVDRLLPMSGRHTRPPSWRPVELTAVVASEIRPWRYPPRFDFQYGDWLRGEFERGNVEPWPTTSNPDLAVLVTMVLCWGVPVFGPPPDELFDPVPYEDLVEAMVGGIDGLLGDLEPDTRNVILTLARIWSTVATGVIRSKDAAADWALTRLPEQHRPVLARARAIYLGEQDESWDDLRPRVRAHAEHVVAEIDRLMDQ
jgi:streptomycin 3"-adenylyltransferase